MNKIRTSAPGRICLFGEHQDYLHLPVITMATNLRINITGMPRNDNTVCISLPDINKQEIFKLPGAGAEITYTCKRDYFRSAFNVLLREGLKLNNGFDVTIHSNIPINMGCSSSSALVISWIQFIAQYGFLSKQFEPEQIAHFGYLAEVKEFNEPGGMMDHYACSLGNVQHIRFKPQVIAHAFKPLPGQFVLGDSKQHKDTLHVLKRVKQGVLNSEKKIKEINPQFNLLAVKAVELTAYNHVLTQDQKEVLLGAIYNRDLTMEAVKLFRAETRDYIQIGKLLTEHHNVLDKLLQISTPKINKLLKVAVEHGALGGKINGSGGGGSMFVYAPDNSKKIAGLIESVGGKAFIVNTDEGIRIETLKDEF